MSADANLPLTLLVRKLETHSAIDDIDRGAILALPYVKRMAQPSEYLVTQDKAITHCTVLVTGYAYRQKITSDGSRQILSIHIPGEALDLQQIFLDQADHNVQALTRAEIAIIPYPAIRALMMERPAIARAVMVSNLIEASIFREWLLNVGRRDARSRIAHLLCEFAVRLHAQGLTPAGGFNLPMTQEQLGDATGLTPVHVNRTLRALESEGLLERDGRNITFPAWTTLSAIADFDPQYLHLRHQVAYGA
jgi:CRP-like cAMP-binding protein